MSSWQSEWSRHYDQIQWIATSIFTVAIGGLLTYSQIEKKFTPEVGFLGLWLTAMTVFYAASFREKRRILHESLPEGEERSYLLGHPSRRRLAQWNVFILTFLIIAADWTYLFWTNHLQVLGPVLGLGTAAVIGLCWAKGKPRRA